MDFLQATVLGIIFGISSWLPVSGLAHLFVASKIFEADISSGFLLSLYIGIALSVLLYFRKRLQHYFVSPKTGLILFLLALPLIFVSIIFGQQLLSYSFFFIGVALLVNSLLLFTSRFFKTEKKITLVSQIAIGLSQILAFIPGISRIGVTFSVGRYFSVTKEQLFLFVSMLSLPTVAGLALREFFLGTTVFGLSEIIGLIFSAAAGYVGLYFFEKRVKESVLHKYWWYSFLLGFVLLFN